jgi:hypothetical protein
MPAWVIAFLTKYLWKGLGILADILVVGFIIYSGWLVFHPKPTTLNSQKAETIQNYNYNCKALIGWGCGKTK